MNYHVIIWEFYCLYFLLFSTNFINTLAHFSCVLRVCSVAVVSDSVMPWTVGHQDPLSMGFSRQEYWSGLNFLLQMILLTQRFNLHLLNWQVDSLPLSHLGSPSPFV